MAESTSKDLLRGMEGAKVSRGKPPPQPGAMLMNGFGLIPIKDNRLSAK
jgi:hypothetical protein